MKILPVITDMAQACRRTLKSNGTMIGWFDKATPDDLVQEFFKIFDGL